MEPMGRNLGRGALELEICSFRLPENLGGDGTRFKVQLGFKAQSIKRDPRSSSRLLLMGNLGLKVSVLLSLSLRRLLGFLVSLRFYRL